jgi:hypothetical protein
MSAKGRTGRRLAYEKRDRLEGGLSSSSGLLVAVRSAPRLNNRSLALANRSLALAPAAGQAQGENY